MPVILKTQNQGHGLDMGLNTDETTGVLIRRYSDPKYRTLGHVQDTSRTLPTKVILDRN